MRLAQVLLSTFASPWRPMLYSTGQHQRIAARTVTSAGTLASLGLPYLPS